MADQSPVPPSESLFSEHRDFLLDTSGQHVKVDAIANKVIGIFIGPHWLPDPLERATDAIAEPYAELRKQGKEIVFVYVTVDRDSDLIDTLRGYGQSKQVDERPDAEGFADVLGKLPDGWLAIPLEDADTSRKLAGLYRAGIFSLAFVGADGALHAKDGMHLLEKWGAEAFPFNDERIDALQKAAKERLEKQNLQILLVHDERDYVIGKNGEQVKVADLEGKIVALYFSAHWCPPCQRFTPVLASIYNQLKEKNEEFEVVFISSDEDQESFDKYFNDMPWLAVPYSDSKTKKLLSHWFEVEGIPTLIILDKHGKTMQSEAMELLYKYGIEAYPFTAERLEELKREEDAKRAAQTLESLLLAKERDYVLSKYGEVKIASLVGKTVGLYFSAHWCPPCRKFTPKLKSVYDELKGRGEDFEIIFLSSDRDAESFKEYFDGMPWLALPFNDSSIRSLSQYFDVKGIPQLVFVGPDGKTVTTDGRGLVSLYGADAFPFTEDAVVEAQERINAKAKSLAKEIVTTQHEHPLKLTESAYEGGLYFCDDCSEQGSGWVYHCGDCGFDLHPDCATERFSSEIDNPTPPEGSDKTDNAASDQSHTHPGYVCEGDVCRKV